MLWNAEYTYCDTLWQTCWDTLQPWHSRRTNQTCTYIWRHKPVRMPRNAEYTYCDTLQLWRTYRDTHLTPYTTLCMSKSNMGIFSTHQPARMPRNAEQHIVTPYNLTHTLYMWHNISVLRTLFWSAEHKLFSYTRIATPYMKKSNNHNVDSINQHACFGMRSTYIVTPFKPHAKRALPSNRFIHVCETRPIYVKRHLATKDVRSCSANVYESIRWPDVCVKRDLYVWKETS